MRTLIRQYDRLLDGFRRASYASCALTALSSVVESAGVAGGLYLLSNGRIGEGLAVFPGCLAASALLFYFGETVRARCILRLDLRTRDEVLGAVMRAGWRRWTDLKLGGTAQGLMADTWALQEAATAYLDTIAQLGSAIAFMIAALTLSPMAIALCALCGLLAMPAHRALLRARAGRGELVPKLIDEAAATAMELFAQFKLVRTTASGDPFVRRIRTLTRAVNDRLYDARALGAQTRLLLLLASSVFAAALGAVWFWVARDSFGRFVAFLILFSRTGNKVVGVARSWTVTREFVVFLGKRERLLKMLDEGAAPRTGTRPVSFSRAIELRDVAYAYGARRILDGVNLRIEKHALIVVTGASSAGKTTLLDLLTGLLPPDRGTITIDDVPLSEITWHDALGVVLQDSPLLHDTILANVAWDQAPDRDRAAWALRQAGLTEDLDTVVGMGGMKLSGGQRQRVGLARALYRDAEFLVLDEPTAALDAETEAEILDMLERLKGTRTIVLVSHRSAALRIADEIWTVGDGTVSRRRPFHGRSFRDGAVNVPSDTLPR